MLIDNCPSHNGFLDIYNGIKSSLELRMLPKLTTSMLQPCELRPRGHTLFESKLSEKVVSLVTKQGS